MNLQQLKKLCCGWSGSVSKKRNGDHFFGVENSKERVRSGLKIELIFGIAQSGRGATISSATCSRRTPKCSQLMLALNTYSFQTIKLKLAAFLPSAAPTGEAPCGAHVFEGFFGLENGPVKSDKSQEKTLFGKEMPEDASRHPKPTSYPQTRQDTVVRVFPMESSN